MARFVIPQPTQAKLAQGGAEGDGPSARIVKYIPAEIVSAYVIVVNALSASGLAGVTGQYVAVGLIAVFTLGTIAYFRIRAPHNQPDVVRKHLLVSPLSFLAWSYPLSAALLGNLFVAWIAVLAQGIVLLLAIVIIPHET